MCVPVARWRWGEPGWLIVAIMNSTWTRRGLLGVLSGALLTGCAGVSSKPDDVGRLSVDPVLHTPRVARADAAVFKGAVAELNVALAQGQLARWRAVFASESPAQALAERVWRNVRQLNVRHIAVEPHPDADLMAVSWRLASDDHNAVESVQVVWSHDKISSLTAMGPAPSWLVADLNVTVQGRIAVIVTNEVAATERRRWTRAATLAATGLRTAALGPVTRGWSGGLAIVLSHDTARFARLIGMTTDQAVSLDGYTLRAKPGSAPRIYLNPRLATVRQTGDLDAALLVHEGLHAAGLETLITAPLWVSEGLAEILAAATSATWAARNREAATRMAQSPPHQMPSDAELTGPAAADYYPLAQVAWEAMAEQWGRAAALRWTSDWKASDRPSDDALVAAFRARLARLS